MSGVIPRYKQYATSRGRAVRGPRRSATSTRARTSTWDVDGDGDPRRVSTLSLWDLYGSYTGFKNWKFMLGVQNLFDKDPPFTNQQTTFQVGLRPDLLRRARAVRYGSVTYSFK